MAWLSALLCLFEFLLADAASFFSIGDWGGAAVSAQDKNNVYAVSNAMAAAASETPPLFILNTGDNFYWCGIQNTSDYQIAVDFEQPYSQPSLSSVQWYSILGNHEYGYQVDAQLEYAMINPKWVMDSRYYTKRLLVDAPTQTYISFIFIDSTPCVLGYRQNNPSNWDPCSSQYPTCSMSDTNDDFEGKCQFHENVVSQSCEAQFSWFKDKLAAVPVGDWLIVSGHHPIDEINVADFTSALQSHGFSIYFNGHSHTLAQYKIDGSGAYVTSGAGSLVNTVDQTHELTAKKVRGEDILASAAPGIGQNHSYTTVFNKMVAGFTRSTFDADFATLTTDYVSYTGAVVHSFTVNKAGVIVD